MSVEQDIGRLLALAQTQGDDIRQIKQNMVTRREFEAAYREHGPINERIDALESHRDRGYVWRKVGDRALFVIVGVAVTAILGTLGML